jgi:CBS domain containing-hemolysin-like protein
MTASVGIALLVSVFLLVANAFFVAAEFALIASKRHRLEEAAAHGSRAAKAAVRGIRELSLMLAGAQLGITLCTLGLGALAKPAVADLIEPLVEATGIPENVSYVIAVVFAVAIVVFLHMVIGEMAPKSWAISHPERSAILLALPFRGFAWISRPALRVLNGMANLCLRLVKVEPQDEIAQAHGPEELLILLAQSREHGLLPEPEHRIMTGVLVLQVTTLEEVMRPISEVVTIGVDDTAADVERVSLQSGRSRLVVLDGNRPVGIVHVRDAVRATSTGHPLAVRQILNPPETMPHDQVLLDAVGVMRRKRVQVSLVSDAQGTVIGLTALEDLLEKILGEFNDETDPLQLR